MPVIPPHLPKPTCNIKNHERWLNIKNIIIVTFFGLLAGVTGASIALGWIWPNFGGGDTWVVSQNRTGLSRSQLAEVIYQDSSERVFNVYSAASAVDSVSYYGEENKLGEAVAVSSDGWLAMYTRAGVKTANYKNWRAVSFDANIFKVEKIIVDSRARVAYLKVAPVKTPESGAALTQFKVIGFYDSPAPFDDIFVHENGDWRYAQIGYPEYGIFGREHLDSAPNRAFAVAEKFTAGTVAINDRGRLVGFIMDNGDVLPGIYLSRVLPKVLSEQKVAYPSLGVSGWFGFEQAAVTDGEQVAGFVVERVLNSQSKLRRGDIITEFGGQIVNGETLWYNNVNKDVTLTVERAGKVFELPAKVTEI